MNIIKLLAKIFIIIVIALYYSLIIVAGIMYVIVYDNYMYQKSFMMIWIICAVISYMAKYINLVLNAPFIRKCNIRRMVEGIVNIGFIFVFVIDIALIIWGIYIWIVNYDYPQYPKLYFQIISINILVIQIINIFILFIRYLICQISNRESGYTFNK